MFPDVTRAQVVALMQSVLAVLVAFGAPITEAQSVAVIALAAVVAAVLMRGDADIRRSRNHRAALESMSSGDPVGDDIDPGQSVEDGATIEHADAQAEL